MLPYIIIGNRVIPMYGLCIMMGVIVSAVFIFRKCRKENLLWENALIIGACGTGFGLICAKLLYIAVSFTPTQFVMAIKNNNFSAVMNGGFVFYGGLAGGILGAISGARIAKSKLGDYKNILITVLPLAHFFGRIGCLCAGCCYGKPTNSAFGIVYKNPIGDAPVGITLIPIQLYEAIYNLLIFAYLVYMGKSIRKNYTVALYLLLYGIGRFMLEFLRYDFARGIYALGFSTSQIISVFVIICSIIMFIREKNKGVLN